MPDPPLSIVVATGKPWPEIRACLDSLVDQASAVGAEILVVDGARVDPPAGVAERYPEVTWIREPGASVFRLRAIGVGRARAEVVAITEDHCRVASDWCARILVAHAEHPDAAAIGGAVLNGAVTSPIDWANFFLVFSPFAPPLENGESEEIALQANISYKRRFVPQETGGPGMMEMLLNRELRARGARLVADDRIRVRHDQSHGWCGTLAAHFHNGRSIAGFRLPEIGSLERAARVASTAVLPPFLLYRTLRNLRGKLAPLTGSKLVGLPLLVPLVLCHAAGELTGYLLGAGDSPRRIA